MEPIDKLKAEKKGLDDRIYKLQMTYYYHDSIYNTLDKEDKDLIDQQYKAMCSYSDILERRIMKLENDRQE